MTLHKTFNGGIGTEPLQSLFDALKDTNNAITDLMRQLLMEENLSSQVDLEKLQPNTQQCSDVRTARQAVEQAIGQEAPQPTGIVQKLNQLSQDLSDLGIKVETLSDTYRPVLLDPGAGPC